MKLIEAMKRIKLNKEKIADLQAKIKDNCAALSIDTLAYKDTANQIESWLQSCIDLSQENVKLLANIQHTNLHTRVSIDLGQSTPTTKSIAEWVWRRREYAKLDQQTYSMLTDRGLREGQMNSSVKDAEPVRVTISRFYDPLVRDKALAMYRAEPTLIDSALEIVNATTEIWEAPL